jgi:hypothetical protein
LLRALEAFVLVVGSVLVPQLGASVDLLVVEEVGVLNAVWRVLLSS